MAIALVVVPWMPQRFTSAPVRGEQVEAVDPYSTQILRATRSFHFQVGTLCTMLSRPRTSTAHIAPGGRSPIATADLQAHERGEAPADVTLHQRGGARQRPAVAQPFLPDERSTHAADGTDPIVVGEV